jgi:hypothetical protein
MDNTVHPCAENHWGHCTPHRGVPTGALTCHLSGHQMLGSRPTNNSQKILYVIQRRRARHLEGGIGRKDGNCVNNTRADPDGPARMILQ